MAQPPPADPNSNFRRNVITGALVGGGLLLAAPPVGILALNAFGWQAGGVAAGSIAAGIQSVVYGASTGGVFSMLQAVGATAVVNVPALGAGIGMMGAAVGVGNGGGGGQQGPAGNGAGPGAPPPPPPTGPQMPPPYTPLGNPANGTEGDETSEDESDDDDDDDDKGPDNHISRTRPYTQQDRDLADREINDGLEEILMDVQDGMELRKAE